MSDFAGMDDMLGDFLIEAGELLAAVDNQLLDLEKRPDDTKLLNEIFRGFHTIKGGAGFLNVAALVELCHLTENLFDQLRNKALQLNPDIMDVIMQSTGIVRDMFEELRSGQQPKHAPPKLLEALQNVLDGKKPETQLKAQPETQPKTQAEVKTAATGSVPLPHVENATAINEPDWKSLLNAVAATAASVPAPAVSITPVSPPDTPRAADNSPGRRASDNPEKEVVPTGRRDTDKVAVARETTIRIDTARLDQVFNLAGEIGLTKNRLVCLRSDVLSGKKDMETLRALDEAVNQLDLLVGDMQNSVMKTRMQPVGRLFQKYPRMARDLARSLGKKIELEIIGEETELDRSMIDDLGDPLVHLVRNAVDHGVEPPEERKAAGKPELSIIRLSAKQAGDHIIIEISDDGRGMRPDVLRRKVVEKGLMDADAASSLDEKQSLQLVFLPGFSTKDQASNISGRGVGMDVVKNNIQKLNGRIDIESIPGQGSTFRISLPLTLAILPVLIVKQGVQCYAVPLAMVHEIIPLNLSMIKRVGGSATLVVRDQVLPVRALSVMLGKTTNCIPRFGVVMQSAQSTFVLAVDGYVGRQDVVIKSLEEVRPKGVAGATLSGSGAVVLVLDIQQLLADDNGSSFESWAGEALAA